MIGAMELSEKALKLEKAAKERKEDYIKENHSGVMDDYKKLRDRILEVLNGGGNGDNGKDEGIMEFSPESEGSTEEIFEFEPDNAN